MKTFFLSLSTSLILVLSSGCGGGQTPKENQPVLVHTPCNSVFHAAGALCGTLKVPERRQGGSSRSLTLPYTVLPALRHSAQPPVLILTGGPGASPLETLQEMGVDSLNTLALRQDRDVVVLNYRGTPGTEPIALACLSSEIAQPLPKAHQECSDRLRAAGVDLSAYTTQDLAQDLEDLRQALGQERHFGRWSVLGISYGSRVAWSYATQFGSGVQNMVLDGPLNADSRMLTGPTALQALDEVVQACQTQDECRTRYPDLRMTLSSVLVELDNQAATVQGQRISGEDLLGLWRQSIPSYSAIPKLFTALAQRQYDELQPLLPQLALIRPQLSRDALLYTTTCFENLQIEPSAPDIASWPAAVLAIQDRLNAQFSVGCSAWLQDATRPQRPPGSRTLPIPTLMLVGRFDPATPRITAQALLPRLPHGRLIEITDQAHGLIGNDECASALATAFLADPSQTLDAGCAARPLHFD